MKILWISHFVPYPPAGGALQRSFHLLRHAARQHEVHLLALHQPRLLPGESDLRASEQALGELCASVQTFAIPAERSRVHRTLAAVTSVLSSRAFDASWLHSTEFRSAIAGFAANTNVDLVHVDTIGLWPHVSGVQWNGRPPAIVLGHHNIESELIARRVQRDGPSLRSRLLIRDAAKLRHLERSAARSASINLVVSALDGDRLREIAPGASVEVVDNGVDTNYWKPGGTRGHGIAFAGTLGWYPNRDAVEFFLRDVWPALIAQNPDRRLVLIGRDPPAAAQAASAGDARVEVTGFVQDVRPYLDGASISVCPIRVGGGTRLKILDALAMAKPLVSTAIGVEGLDLHEGEHYLRAETGEEFVRQIDRLEADAALRDRLASAGRQRVVERYDWSVIGRQLDTGYARALKSAGEARRGA